MGGKLGEREEKRDYLPARARVGKERGIHPRAQVRENSGKHGHPRAVARLSVRFQDEYDGVEQRERGGVVGVVRVVGL